MDTNLHFLDWGVIVSFLLITLGVGALFTKKAGKDIASFFVSGRSLPWYVAGVSMIATSFASDTPIWITSLIRRYGLYYVWQYWSPMIGLMIATVLFARLWRRSSVVTDVEFIEFRYSGKSASALRFAMGILTALLMCPLIVGWVTKAMVTIAQEAMGLGPGQQVYITVGVIIIAMILCALSGLYGVVYTDFLQFIVALIGTIILAYFAVKDVGGLNAMVEKLSAMQDWSGHRLNIAPDVGPGPLQMSLWNAVGYFGILWFSNASQGGYNAQRLLACKNTKHATYALLLFALIYVGIICWPWIIVGTCSIIKYPALGEGLLSHDNAYPRMIIALLPVGLRGMLIAAMLAAFISTISTMFNWSSSYLVNDIYKRFIVKNASDSHYVVTARIATFLIAIMGGTISFLAENIQDLLQVFYVAGVGTWFMLMFRFLWWRLNAIGELVSLIAGWVVALLLLFTPIFNAPAAWIFNLEEGVEFNSDPDLLGARMLFMMIVTVSTAIIVSLMTRPTDEEKLKEFVIKTKPISLLWKPVIKKLDFEYRQPESLLRIAISWITGMISGFSLIFGLGKLFFGAPGLGVILLIVSLITLIILVKRLNSELAQNG